VSTPKVSIYQRKGDGRWCAAVSDGTTDKGRRRRRYFYGATRVEAFGKYAEWSGISPPLPSLQTAEDDFEQALVLAMPAKVRALILDGLGYVKLAISSLEPSSSDMVGPPDAPE